MGETRICKMCNKKYDINYFDIANSKTGYRRRECKLCRSEKNKKYYNRIFKDIEENSDDEEMNENKKIYEEIFKEKLT